MERSAVLMSRNAVGLQILNAVRTASDPKKRIVSGSAPELLRWLDDVLTQEERAAAQKHFV